jgi:hypothetical protein
MCPPNTDVTISAIYRCHWVGRWAGASPGVAQRPTGPEGDTPQKSYNVVLGHKQDLDAYRASLRDAQAQSVVTTGTFPAELTRTIR